MKFSKPDLTVAQINFFEVEIRNEKHGGISPATLASAMDSLLQAPADVIIEWCDDDTVNSLMQVRDFIASVQKLETVCGEETTLESLLPEENK